MNTVYLRTLGEFSLTAGENTIHDLQSRSKKTWCLLAYLIQYRGMSFSSQKLIDQFWGDDSDSANPENALRITLHRLRSQLDRLWSGAGRELILYRNGRYCWNEEIPIFLDFEEFETLCRSQARDDDQRLEQLLSALKLYRGPYLPRQNTELWAVPPATHFSNLFLSASMEAAELLSRQKRHQEAVALCRTAAQSEPYHETLHGILIRELAAAGDPKAAATVYNDLSRRLSEEFGILPGEDIRAVYRSITGSPKTKTLSMDEVMDHLQDIPVKRGALRCDYDYFKILCDAKIRSLDRSGGIAHIALLHITGINGASLSSHCLKRNMELFGTVLQQNLRLSDAITQCSVSQYIILLPDANYENSCMVCRRVIAAFHHQHPHVSSEIHFLVQPLTPYIRVP